MIPSAKSEGILAVSSLMTQTASSMMIHHVLVWASVKGKLNKCKPLILI